MDATVIPWGYTPGHDAFGALNDDHVQHEYRVLETANTPEAHENHAFVMSSFRNSTLFKELEYDNINRFLWNMKPLFIILLCNCERDSDFALTLFEERLGRYKNEMNFLFALPETVNQYNIITTFELDQLPNVIIDNIPMGLNNDKFQIQTDVSSHLFVTNKEYAADQLVDFIRGFFEESAPRVVRSEMPHPLPWDEPGKMWDLVGSNFRYLVIDDDTHDVLLLVYSPNCPACRAIMPIFGDLAESLADFGDKIRVATFDKSANDFPVGGLYLKMYPTVYFFPANRKYESINFYDFRTFHFTEEGLLDFVRQHADNVIDYDVVKESIRNKPEKPYDGDCEILSPETFQSIVMDGTKDVFVDYYAPWCAYCKMLTPTWEELCTFYKNQSNIVIGKFDCAKYESFGASLRIRAYPTMLFYPQNRKSHPWPFRSARNLDTLKNFVESKKTVSPMPTVPYGEDGQAFRAEEPCLLRNDRKVVNLSRITESGDVHDDFRVTDGEYDFFVGICHPTKRRCLNKDFDYPIIQVKPSDPDTHCYYLGRHKYTHAYIVEGGEKPVSVIRYYGGEVSDDFRTRVSEIVAHCAPELTTNEFEFVGETHDVGQIVYTFELRSSLACNIN